MRADIQRDFTILRDTREKKPLLFPAYLTVLSDRHLPTAAVGETVRLTVIEATLPFGDYALAGHTSGTVVERKGSLREVSANCLSRDRPRFLAALARLRSSCSHPVLMLEGSPSSLTARSPTDPDPGIALSALLRALATHNIAVLLLPSTSVDHRRSMGEWVARMLIEGALCHGNTQTS